MKYTEKTRLTAPSCLLSVYCLSLLLEAKKLNQCFLFIWNLVWSEKQEHKTFDDIYNCNFFLDFLCNSTESSETVSSSLSVKGCSPTGFIYILYINASKKIKSLSALHRKREERESAQKLVPFKFFGTGIPPKGIYESGESAMSCQTMYVVTELCLLSIQSLPTPVNGTYLCMY